MFVWFCFRVIQEHVRVYFLLGLRTPLPPNCFLHLITSASIFSSPPLAIFYRDLDKLSVLSLDSTSKTSQMPTKITFQWNDCSSAQINPRPVSPRTQWYILFVHLLDCIAEMHVRKQNISSASLVGMKAFFS